MSLITLMGSSVERGFSDCALQDCVSKESRIILWRVK